jgi:hypothetical protein
MRRNGVGSARHATSSKGEPMNTFEPYLSESTGSVPSWRRRCVALGSAILLAAASFLALASRDDPGARLPRVILPGSGGVCTAPPNGALFSQAVDGVQMNVCISQQGNINQIQYPDTATGHTQIAFDGYCLSDAGGTNYRDYSPGSPVVSSGFGPATLTQTATNVFSMTRNTNDGKYQLTEFIKINFQPRSVFVGMTVKNIDPANVTHQVGLVREFAPAIDGSAADDQYNEFGRTGGGIGATGLAFQGPVVGSNALLFGATQSPAVVRTATLANFQAGAGCANYSLDPAGPVMGGNRVFLGFLSIPFASLAPSQSVNLGKFVYRMA